MLTVVSVRVQDYNVADGSFVRTHLNDASENLPFLSVFQHARDINNRPNAQRFVLGMPLHGYYFYMMDHATVRLTAYGAWVRRWLHWAGRGVMWCRCRGNRTDYPFI